MIPSRVVAAPGVRSVAIPGWRAHLGIAVAVVLGGPRLWIIGALGFALRGGIVLLLLPILILPTPVEVRLLLGSSLGSSGLTADFWTLVAFGSAVCSVGLIALLLVLARLEMSAFDHLVRDPETADLRGWRPVARLSAERRRQMLGWTFAVQALGLLGIVVAAVPLAAAVGPAVLDEIVRPSSSTAIYVRVLERVAPQLLLVGAALLIVEMLSAVATRYVLSRGYGLWHRRSTRRPASVEGALFAARRLLRAPAASLASAALGWLVTLLVLAPAVWALGAVWQTTRSSFLSSTSVADLLGRPESLLVAGLLAGVMLAGLLLAGLASAFRSASWTVEMLRRADLDQG